MKNLFTILAVLFLPLLLFSKPVDEATANKVGYNFLIGHTTGSQFKNGEALQLVYKSSSNATNADLNYFFVFNATNGFIIVSADDNAIPILGYSNEGTFNANDIAPQIAKWLEGYKSQIRNIIVNGIQATPQISDMWTGLISNSKPDAPQQSSTGVSPLTKTTWNQSPYYNSLCPYDNAKGQNAVTGCVATAMAQVLKYWNYPTTGLDNHSYNDNTYGTQSANFAGTTYQWSSMSNNVSSPNTAVATLMYHCGVSVDMSYGVDESSAYVISSASPVKNCAEYALKTYFGYKTTLSGIERKNYSDADWIKAIESEMDNSRPVIYAGFGTGGGHCFVCDGYDANNFLHFNWGWAGQDNGYFQIDALNPGTLGTGGGAGGFNSGQQAIIGIEPTTTGGGGSSSAFDLRLYDYVTPSTATVYYGQSFYVSTNIINDGTNDFAGDYCAAIFDNTNTFIDYVQIITGASLPKGDIYQSDLKFTYATSFALLPGTYTIGVYYRPTGGSWSLVTSSGSYTNYLQIKVINPGNIEMYANMAITPTGTLTQGGSISVHLDVANMTANQFTGKFVLGLYNFDGTAAFDIQELTGASLNANSHYTNGLTFSNSNLNVAPGSYLLAMTYVATATTSNYLVGSTNYANPIKVTIQAPPISPDKYEPNNDINTAYDFTPNYSNDIAIVNTDQSNCHIGSDVDYYKIDLLSGYTYSISAHLDDSKYTTNSNAYTLDAVFSYSTDGGNTWSETFDDVMPSDISANSGFIYFKIAPYFEGETGTYLLETKITRTKSNSGINTSNISTNDLKIYPNPANDLLNIDIENIIGNVSQISIMDMQGKELISKRDILNNSNIVIPVNELASGLYMVQIQSDKGVISRKITIQR